jgi:hypothetical protein
MITCRSPAFNFLAYLFALMVVLGCSVWTPAKAQKSAGSVTRAYTIIDDVRADKNGLCKTISKSGDSENPVISERCPTGPRGWPVTMFSADARVYVWFGEQAKVGATVMDALNGAFADPHSVIEWRLRDGEPYAAIHRYFFDGKQMLTVHKLNRDRTSCVAAVVAIEPGRDANADAIRIADDVVPNFRCGDDKLITAAQATSPSAQN